LLAPQLCFLFANGPEPRDGGRHTIEDKVVSLLPQLPTHQEDVNRGVLGWQRCRARDSPQPCHTAPACVHPKRGPDISSSRAGEDDMVAGFIPLVAQLASRIVDDVLQQEVRLALDFFSNKEPSEEQTNDKVPNDKVLNLLYYQAFDMR